MSIEDIEAEISSLPPEQLAQFSKWFEDFMADQWDRQIERDTRSGRLDGAIERADDHYKAGRCTPL